MRVRINAAWSAWGACSCLLFVGLMTANMAKAQVATQIDATLKHSFIVGEKTLPPGKYTFQVQGPGDSSFLLVQSDGKNLDQVMVRQSEAETTPAHTELVFRRYGNKEFLTKIYAGGNKLGVAVMEPSKLEKELIAKGQKPVEHTESAD